MQATVPGLPAGLSQFGKKLFIQKQDMLCGWRGMYPNTAKAASAGDGGVAAGCCHLLLSHVVQGPEHTCRRGAGEASAPPSGVGQAAFAFKVSAQGQIEPLLSRCSPSKSGPNKSICNQWK